MTMEKKIQEEVRTEKKNKENLSIKQVQAAKREMDDKILVLLTKFEHHYNLHIQDVSIHTATEMNGVSKIYEFHTTITL